MCFSAGSRDSPLTNHGVLQARRLGAHLAGRIPSIGPVRRIFSSNLQRAATTAQAIIDAQSVSGSPNNLPRPALVQLPELREKDFGSGEGKRFGSRTEVDQSDSESHEAMRVRIDRFIEEHLTTTLVEATTSTQDKSTVVIVAHGIILNVLLKSILLKFAAVELSRLANLGDGQRRSEHLAAWSNTGYLEIIVESKDRRPKNGPLSVASGSTEDRGSMASMPAGTKESDQPALKLRVAILNCVEHLQGLKKTRGGIGSLKFDNKQQTMDSYFSKATKKPKLADNSDT